MILILDKILQALCFHISALEYFKDRVLCFEDVTNTDNLILKLNTRLNHRLEQKNKQEKKENNKRSKVTDFKEEVVKKKNKCTERRKAWLISFYAEV